MGVGLGRGDWRWERGWGWDWVEATLGEREVRVGLGSLVTRGR